MSRGSVRDAWLADVMFRPGLGDSCRRLLLCYAMASDSRGPWMSSSGRIRPIKHRVVGEALTMAEKTVANHVLEATKKGYLAKVPDTGYRGRPAAYQATFPPGERLVVESPVSLRDLVAGALKVPGIGEPSSPGIREPFPPPDGTKVPGFGEAQRVRGRVRATSKTHGTQPAPAGSRGVGEADPASTDGTYGDEWLPAPFKRPSSCTERAAG